MEKIEIKVYTVNNEENPKGAVLEVIKRLQKGQPLFIKKNS